MGHPHVGEAETREDRWSGLAVKIQLWPAEYADICRGHVFKHNQNSDNKLEDVFKIHAGPGRTCASSKLSTPLSE